MPLLRQHRTIWCVLCALLTGWCRAAQTLSGTSPLLGTNDLADAYLSGVDRFMLAMTARVGQERAQYWHRAFTDGGAPGAAYSDSVATNRQQLSRLIGVRDERVAFDAPEPVATLARSAVLGETDTHTLLEIRWPVLGGFWAEGLLLDPKTRPVLKNIVHIPHAGVSPEQLLGLATDGTCAAAAGFSFPPPGCRMVLPAVVSRSKTEFQSAFSNPGKGQLPGKKVMPNREFVYRPAYVMGRHIIGYEVQSVLALVDWFCKDSPSAPACVEGWGDGGMLSLYAGALDTRIAETSVAGYFSDRSGLWQEPIDRNVFGLLVAFGDAEIATLIAPRKLTVIASPGPVETITRIPGEGGAPGALVSPEPDAVVREVDKARALVVPLKARDWLTLVQRTGTAAEIPAAKRFTGGMRLPDAVAREQRLIQGMNAFSQHMLALSSATRRAFLDRLDYSSPEAFDRSAEWYRAYYRTEVMGQIMMPKLALNPRTRLVYETEDYACYDVVLDVFTDFMLTGQLLMPKSLRAGETYPVAVVQHGRGGTPRTPMAFDRGGVKTYHEIAPCLAKRGYIVFAPQNPYIFEDRYRQLQRKANPLRLSLYSVIHAQYEQMFAWFATLPQIDLKRVAFLGQSYGGKTAVRVPPVMPGFCLAISTGDFNEGVTKMASTVYPFSFALWDEYEMFEFDLGNTFNYSDLASLMAPRPFMVERGHGDTVGWDEFVGYEYARVQRTYAQLKISDRTAIDWFDGGHEIDVGPAIAFFDRFLKDGRGRAW